MSTALLPLSARTYQPHALHHSERVWPQTNCWVDVTLEMLHALGLDPLAAAAFTVAGDFESDQWTFYKYPPEDLWSTYGVDVHEMSPWRGVVVHVVEQLAAGRFMTVEVDAFHLPDTRGTSYRESHVKTTVIINEVDLGERRLGYFHNAGYHELEGEDFDALLGLGDHAGDGRLPPYTEIVRLESLRRLPADELTEHAWRLLHAHLPRRPADNPVPRMGARIEADLDWVRATGPETFHGLAFATLRQCGASAEMAGAYCAWLAARRPDLRDCLLRTAHHWDELAQSAQAAQMKLARAAHGRTVDLESAWTPMTAHWARAQDCLDALPAP